MKHKPLTLFISILIASTACKKDNNNTLTGKWQEVKLREYNQDKTTGIISNDTTYQAATFTGEDYAQFSGTNNCTISHSLPPEADGPISRLIETYTYSCTGSGYALTQTGINSGSIDVVSTMDTITNFSGNSLVVHSVANSVDPTGYTIVFDAYYSK